MKAVTLFLKNNDNIACIYDRQWWLGVVDIDLENNNELKKFYHPAEPRTSLKM